MTSTTDRKRQQTDRDRAVRRRLRAGVLRLGGHLEITVSRPVQETFLFSSQVPQFSPILERIERDNIVYLSARSTVEAALKHAAPDSAVGIPFDKPTGLSDLLRQYEEWDAAGRPR